MECMTWESRVAEHRLKVVRNLGHSIFIMIEKFVEIDTSLDDKIQLE